jgi:VCBS repeat-containing protein
VTTNEDTAYTFNAADFNFSDADGDTLASVQITTLESVGSLQLGGVDVTLNQVITKADIDAGLLTFTPVAEANGAGYDSFGFTVNDGTTDSVSSYTLTVDVTAINDTPTTSAVTLTAIGEDSGARLITQAELLANANDVDGDALTATNLAISAGAGALVDNGNGTWSYTPAGDDDSSVSFSYTITDGVAPIAASASLDITPVNDEQVLATNTGATVAEGSSGNVITTSMLATTDVDNSAVELSYTLDAAPGNGTLYLSGVALGVTDTFTQADIDAGNVSYDHDGSQTSSDSFDFTVDDGAGATTAASFSVTVSNTNDAPTAANNTVTTNEDTAYTFNAADFNFSDADGDTLASVQITTLESVGSLQLGGVDVTLNQVISRAAIDAGDLTFTPVAEANGAGYDSFGFTVNDGTTDSVSSYTLTVDVTAINDTPTTSAVTLTAIGEDSGARLITQAELLANANDVDGDTLTATNLAISAGVGALVDNGNGTWSYTPAGDDDSSVSFSYTITDGVAPIAASASLDITPVNDAPVASANTVNTTEDNAHNFAASDFTFFDVEGDSMVSATLTNFSLAGGTLTHSSGIAVIDGDTLTAAELNTLVYTPAANANGAPLATFDYTVNDGDVGVFAAQMSVDVAPVNDLPQAMGNTVTTTEDNPYTFSNADFTFADVEGDGLVSATITNLNLAGGTLMHSGGSPVNDGDTLTAAQIDTLVYTPAPNANGTPLATFDFSVNDAGTGVVTAQMAIDVTAQPDAAVIGGVNSGMVTEDVDPDMDNLLEVSGALTIIDPDAGEAVFNAGVIGGSYGVLTLNVDGSWDYAANNGQPAIQGLAAGATLTDTFAVSSADGTGHTVTITIMGTNDAPVAGNDVASVNEGGSVVIAVAATDSDIDSVIDLNSIVITSLPSNGSVVVNGDGTVTYTHNGNESLSDSFSYTISDISGAVSTAATVSIAVTPMNDAPAAGNDVITVAEGNTTVIDLAANDSDADNALDLNSITIIGAPAHGMLLVNGDGTVTYSHEGSNTTSDSFSYTIADISGAISNTATVTINITAVNDAPTTSGIADITVNEDAPATHIDLNAAFDDSDNLDSELRYSIVGNTDIGLFSAAGINGNGQLTLDYAANMNGATQITVRATDPSGQSVDTLFTVTVTPVNDNPLLQANNGMMVAHGTATTISSDALNATDIDNPNEELVYTLTALPANGTLMLNGEAMTVNATFTQADLDNNRMVYQANGTAATDQFGFTVADGAGGTLGNRMFNIAVQLRPVSEDSNTSTTIETPATTTEEPEVRQETSVVESGTGGLIEGAGAYGGEFVPFGSAAVPPPSKPTPVLSLDPATTTELSAPRQIRSLEEIDFGGEAADYELSTFAGVQMQSMEALWTSVDKMKQEMAESAAQMDMGELKVAAAKSSGIVLTAGIVAWAMRGGALLSSMLSTIPLWKGYDPLPVLAYKDDDEDEDKVKVQERVIDQDTIPTSLEELKKLREIKSKKAKQIDIDTLFGGSAIRE